MLVIDHPSVAIVVTSMRAKVSHSWLDHEIALVSSDTAAKRWRSSSWGRLNTTFKSFYSTAKSLGDGLMGFSPSVLVEQLAPLSGLAEPSRSLLKSRLDELFIRQSQIVTTKIEYQNALQSLWSAVSVFHDLVEAETSDEETIKLAWARVRFAGADLKTMFSEDKIPRGILLP
jgi:hypothetical protein